MNNFICAKFVDRYLIIQPAKNVGVNIDKAKFEELNVRTLNRDETMPGWLAEILMKLGCPVAGDTKLSDAVFVRNSLFNFGKASFEITDKCNYQCGHCYLGKKSGVELPIEQKKKILDLIEKSGSLWLQITGGEPLLSRDFVEIYQCAHSLGLLVTVSTNGFLLNRKEVKEVFSALPPYRIAVSLYGAAAQSYEQLTRVKGSFDRMMRGLFWLSKAKIRTRLNIIIHKYNEKEVAEMVDIAKSFGFEHHVFSKLSPAIDGNPLPMELMADECAQSNTSGAGNGFQCMAGKTFFNVDALGRAMICKIARQSNIDLLAEGVDGLSQLSAIAERLMEPSVECNSCGSKQTCRTCPSVLSLYRESKVIPVYVCKYGNRFARKE